MELEHYKALFYLASSFGAFTILMLALRLISSRSSNQQMSTAQSTWIGMQELEIVEVIAETHNIRSFRLKRKNGEWFPPFQAGQFLSFSINNDPKAVRSYSISSSELNRELIQVSVKLLKDGLGSTWFHTLKAGDFVKCHAPSGHFVDDYQGGETRVLVAGGVGITPVLSILLSSLEHGVTYPIVMFYGVRSQKDLAFHGLLTYLSERHLQFTYHPILSQDPQWDGDHGHITIDFLQKKLGELIGLKVYICGPEPMSESLMAALEKQSIPEEALFMEQFISPASMDESVIEERQVVVNWMGEALNYQGRENLLQFLENQGKSLPYACRTGVCGSCKCKIKGVHKSLSKAGLTRKEQKEGFSLACVSFPEADIEVTL